MGLLIVLEKAGKFLCISTGDARGVWYSLLQSQPIGLKLQEWKIPHHHALDSNPSALLSADVDFSSNTMSIVHAHTRKAVQVIHFPFMMEVALITSQKMDHEIYEVAASIQPEIV
ncbi:hypothetical protein Tco_1431110 [Tanacetum coccineum]